MDRWMIAATLLVSLGLVTTVGSVVSTHAEIRRYFDMPDYVGVVPDNVQRAILDKLPLGSSRSDAVAFLNGHGIGQRGGSFCSQIPDGHEIWCELGGDHHFWEVTRETFSLWFVFGADAKLSAVRVRSRFSYPWRS